jgi:hypothetical protein
MINQELGRDANLVGINLILVRGTKAKNSPVEATVYGRKQGVKEIAVQVLDECVHTIYRKNGSAPSLLDRTD